MKRLQVKLIQTPKVYKEHTGLKNLPAKFSSQIVDGYKENFTYSLNNNSAWAYEKHPPLTNY